MKDIDEMVKFANELAELSREIILSHSILDVNHVIKADGSPVTPVDREVEQRLREHIDARYPQHGVFGEEFPNHNTDAERVWVIDPIDGTRQYATGIPLYSTLIGLAEAFAAFKHGKALPREDNSGRPIFVFQNLKPSLRSLVGIGRSHDV